MHKTDSEGASEHSEQFGMGNKVKIQRKTGKEGRERLNKRLCTTELGRKEEWEAVVDEEKGNQSRRKIHVNKKHMHRKRFLLWSAKNRPSVPLNLNGQKTTEGKGKNTFKKSIKS